MVLERVWDPVSIWNRILERFGGFWKDFGWILKGFWKDFGKIFSAGGGHPRWPSQAKPSQGKPSQAKPRPPLFKPSQPKLQIWVPLICVDFRWFALRPDVSIFNIKFNHTFFVIISMLGRFREVLGGPNGGPNRFFNRFFSMLFSNAFWHRFWVDFWNLGTRQINKNHCFFQWFLLIFTKSTLSNK